MTRAIQHSARLLRSFPMRERRVIGRQNRNIIRSIFRIFGTIATSAFFPGDGKCPRITGSIGQTCAPPQPAKPVWHSRAVQCVVDTPGGQKRSASSALNQVSQRTLASSALQAPKWSPCKSPSADNRPSTSRCNAATIANGSLTWSPLIISGGTKATARLRVNPPYSIDPYRRGVRQSGYIQYSRLAACIPLVQAGPLLSRGVCPIYRFIALRLWRYSFIFLKRKMFQFYTMITQFLPFSAAKSCSFASGYVNRPNVFYFRNLGINFKSCGYLR